MILWALRLVGMQRFAELESFIHIDVNSRGAPKFSFSAVHHTNPVRCVFNFHLSLEVESVKEF